MVVIWIQSSDTDDRCCKGCCLTVIHLWIAGTLWIFWSCRKKSSWRWIRRKITKPGIQILDVQCWNGLKCGLRRVMVKCPFLSLSVASIRTHVAVTCLNLRRRWNGLRWSLNWVEGHCRSPVWTSGTMSTTYAILLPSEVVDLIIGNLSPTDDAATLYSCSRVSRTFSSAARRGIFSTLVINAHKTSQDQNLGFRTVPRSVESTTHRNKALASLLADPTFGLALLVRELQIRIDTRCLIINESSHLNEVLIIIHSRASNLNTLSLGSEPQSAASIRERSWSELPVETASILLSMCRTLPVSQLRFLYFSDIPSSILTSPQYPHLHRIELQWTTFVPTVENNDSTLEEETNTVSSLVAYLPRYGSCLISRHKIVVIRAYIFVFSNPEPKGDLARLLYLLEHGLPKSLVSFAW